MTLAFPRGWYIAFWIVMAVLVRWWLVSPITRRLDALLEALKGRQ